MIKRKGNLLYAHKLNFKGQVFPRKTVVKIYCYRCISDIGYSAYACSTTWSRPPQLLTNIRVQVRRKVLSIYYQYQVITVWAVGLIRCWILLFTFSGILLPTKMPIKAHYMLERYGALKAYQTYVAVPAVLHQEVVAS